MRRDLPGRQPFRIQRQHDLVDLSQPALPLLHDLRLERPFPIPRHLDLHLAGRVRDHRLRPGAVAHVRRLPARLGLFFSWPRCSVISSFSAVSSTFLVNSFNNPSGPVSARPRCRPRPPSPPRRPAPATAAARRHRSSCVDSQVPDVITHSAHPAGPSRRVGPETPTCSMPAGSVVCSHDLPRRWPGLARETPVA